MPGDGRGRRGEVLGPGGRLGGDWLSHIALGPMKAGETALTRIACGARSLAALSANPTSAALEAE